MGIGKGARYIKIYEYSQELSEFDPLLAYDLCDAVCDDRLFFGSCPCSLVTKMEFYSTPQWLGASAAGRVVHGLCSECGDGV